MRKITLILLFIAFTTLMVEADNNIIGKWKTVDDITGEFKSIVEISIKDGKLYGNIVQLFNEDPLYDPICTKCKDDLKGNKIIGMKIINGLSLTNGKWRCKKGILDPDNGKYYNCRIWLDKENTNKLIVKGNILFFFRTQKWLREY